MQVTWCTPSSFMPVLSSLDPQVCISNPGVRRLCTGTGGTCPVPGTERVSGGLRSWRMRSAGAPQRLRDRPSACPASHLYPGRRLGGELEVVAREAALELGECARLELADALARQAQLAADGL